MNNHHDCKPLADSQVGNSLRLDIAARRYLGTPFLHQGRNPDAGIDCVGLLVLAASDCGMHALAAHDSNDYDRNPSAQGLERRLTAALGRPIAGPLNPGYVVSIDFHGQTRHVAIIGEQCGLLTLIHALNRPPKVCEHGINDAWLRRISGIYRVGGAA